MKQTIAAAILASTFALPVFAEPVTYTVDTHHTYPRFSYTHLGFSKQIQRFDNTTGTVVYDAQARTATVDITIDMTSVDTGYDTFDGHIQGEDFFDTAKYPTATFKSTKVVFDGDTPKAIEGELTMKGITKPVTLEVTSFKSTDSHPMLNKPAIGANAVTTVKRTEFNAGKYAPAVSDEVVIDIALEAIAK
ncbi:YceI family protein [Nitrogeniibacter aestuarii]|uniref:YceI family protein n=1 Tax=Nitrogeniibacter aestuarii TaxID=2815343 RepID=UPI001D129568|nr:YceI family protein [Nitrogeniibacter aestuarii]